MEVDDRMEEDIQEEDMIVKEIAWEPLEFFFYTLEESIFAINLGN